VGEGGWGWVGGVGAGGKEGGGGELKDCFIDSTMEHCFQTDEADFVENLSTLPSGCSTLFSPIRLELYLHGMITITSKLLDL